MPCLFALFAGMFPRLADIFIWIARPTQFMNTFNDKWWWPVLGDHLPAIHHIDVCDPGMGCGWYIWLGLVLDCHGSIP